MNNSVIAGISDVAANVRKIDFKWDQKLLPGQFIMLWYPGVGEIPMSISHLGDPKSITVKAYGTVSSKIMELGKGDRLYFRGPLGNGFNVRGKKRLLIGGGSGMASLHPMIERGVHGIVAGRTSADLIFLDEFDQDRVLAASDDGSSGFKGTALDALKTLDPESFDSIYVCGPEAMMFAIMKHLAGKHVYAEFSLERSMKCGIGVCDSCSIDGNQICTQGPVFSLESVRKMREFGLTRLTTSGKRIRF